MMPVSGVNVNAPQRLTAAEKTLGAPRARKAEEEKARKPVMDEYVPEEKQEPSGRYWLGRDEEGRPKVCFDDPEAEGPKRAADGPKRPEDAPEAEEPNQADQGAKGPEGKKDKDEVWECDTDKVDREIEKLKKKQQELEQRPNTETDEAKIKDLERQLAQVNRELSRKDNDTYRKNHATVTRLS